MKINLVSEATYYPSRVALKKGTISSQRIVHNPKPKSLNEFEKLLLDKLNRSEATTIRRLFGEFQPGGKSGPVDDVTDPTGKLGSIPLGSFIDITV